MDYGMTSANLRVRIISRCGNNPRTWDLSHDENCAEHDTLKASEDGSAMTGSVSLILMFDKRRVTRRWSFFRMGLISSA